MSKHDIIDDDGNIIAPPEPGSPIHQLVWLLEYGRKRGFKIGPEVQIGEVHLHVRDLRQERDNARDSSGPSDLDTDPDMALILGRSSGG